MAVHFDQNGPVARELFFDCQYYFNVIDLTNRFITWVETPLLYAVFSWIFSARPDWFNGHDEQVKQLVQNFHREYNPKVIKTPAVAIA